MFFIGKAVAIWKELGSWGSDPMKISYYQEFDLLLIQMDDFLKGFVHS